VPGSSLAPVLALAAGLGVAACDASYVDLRPTSGPLRSDPSVDAGVSDAGGAADAGGSPGLDAGASPSGPVREGAWGGRGDYSARGSARLVRDPDARLFLELSSDFSVSRVPGPVLVLSRREALGSRLDPGAGDVELGPLAANAGAQRVEVPPGSEDRAFAWVFCKPFGLEVGRAELVAP
jgi:hypothetical protein